MPLKHLIGMVWQSLPLLFRVAHRKICPEGALVHRAVGIARRCYTQVGTTFSPRRDARQ